MAEAAATADDEEKPVVRSAGLPVKLVILIAGGTLVLGLIGTFAYFKFSGHKEEASAEAAPHGKEETSKEHGNVGVRAPCSISTLYRQPVRCSGITLPQAYRQVRTGPSGYCR